VLRRRTGVVREGTRVPDRRTEVPHSRTRVRESGTRVGDADTRERNFHTPVGSAGTGPSPDSVGKQKDPKDQKDSKDIILSFESLRSLRSFWSFLAPYRFQVSSTYPQLPSDSTGRKASAASPPQKWPAPTPRPKPWGRVQVSSRSASRPTSLEG
jgi:hypothetical protein